MDLTLLNPWFLWFLPLAGLPIIFHLFFRYRKRVRPFSTFLFFNMIDQKFSARRKLREWLILLLRVLTIILLILGLSRFVWLGSGSAVSVARIIIIDNSASMSAPGKHGVSKLSTAVEAAENLVRKLRNKDNAIVLLLVEDPTVSLPPSFDASREQIINGLKQITDTEASGKPGNTLRKAHSLLADSSASRFEIHILSDLQETEWKKSLSDITPRPGTQLYVHQLDSKKLPGPNAAIADSRILKNRVIVNRSIPVELTISNSGKATAELQLKFSDDTGLEEILPISVTGKGEKRIYLNFKMSTPGIHWLKFQLMGDSFAGDNSSFLVFNCIERERVLFLGERKSFAMLPLMLSPTGSGQISGFNLGFGSFKQLEKELEKSPPPAIIISTWKAFAAALPEERERLREHIREGGNFFLLPDAHDLTNVTGVSKWVGSYPYNIEKAVPTIPIIPLTGQSRFWRDLKNERGELKMEGLTVQRFAPLSANPETVPLLGLEDGRVLFSALPLKNGTVFSSGLAFDRSWSNLPLRGRILALIHSLILTGGKQDHRLGQIRAGEKAPIKNIIQNLHLRSITGDPIDWKGKLCPTLPRSGVFKISVQGKGDSYAAVRSAAPESLQKFIRNGKVPALSKFIYTVRDYQSREDFQTYLKHLSLGLDLAPLLLALAFILLLLESYYANSGKIKKIFHSKHGHPAICLLWVSGLQWNPSLNLFWSASLLLLAGILLYLTFFLLKDRFPTRKTWLLFAPRLCLVILMIIALFNPALFTIRTAKTPGKILALLDRSASMEVIDDNRHSRYQRGKDIIRDLTASLPAGVDLETREFDTEIYPVNQNKKGPSKTAFSGTDILGSLVMLSGKMDLSAYRAIILLTDGGDEASRIADLPSLPIHSIGIGTSPKTWDDLAINNLHAPEIVEKDIEFKIKCDLTAQMSNPTIRSAKLQKLDLKLEKLIGKDWQPVEEQQVNLEHGRARITFSHQESNPGIKYFRLSLPEIKGEISTLNNTRHFKVNIRKKSLHVLFYSTRLSTNYKFLRNEIARDPGISFTALFPTVSRSFTLQGDRLNGDDALMRGFPQSTEVLSIYDCLILGSFPAVDLSAKQSHTLLAYIKSGGAVIFLGGSESFGRGAYAKSVIAPLFPWQISDLEPEIIRGKFPVILTSLAASGNIFAGIEQVRASGEELYLQSLNQPGPVNPGAENLLLVRHKNRMISVVARQNYGQGKTLGIASDTMWKWATSTPTTREFYGRFWRQALRNLASSTGVGSRLKVQWDKGNYRPGEAAIGKISYQAGGEKARFNATIAAPDNQSTELSVEPIIGSPGLYSVKAPFKRRGDYAFRLVVYHGNQEPESYEHTFSVSPLAGEGSNLELEEAFLKEIAEKSLGQYCAEKNLNPLLNKLQNQLTGKAIPVEISLIRTGPYFLILLLLLMMLEWYLRRKENLI